MNLFHSLTLFVLVFVSIIHSGRSQQHINGTRRVFKPELEAAALAKFRRMVGKHLYDEYMKSDTYLLRWLRDQRMDLELASEKLLNSLKWRKANRVDSVLREDFSDIIKQCPYDLSGRDRNGRPFLTAALGECHLRRIVLSGKVEKLNRAVIHLLETMSVTGRAIEKSLNGTKDPIPWMVIADMSGLSYREHMCINCFPFFLEMMAIYFNHYPQTFKDIYVINASRITVTLVEAMRSFAPINPEESLYAFGYDKKEWQTELLRKVKAEQLPPIFGGTKISKNLKS